MARQVDWGAEGRAHARKVWEANGRKLEGIEHEPFAGKLEPKTEKDRSALRDGYRSELHLLALRAETGTRPELEPLTAEFQALGTMRTALKRHGFVSHG